MTLFCDSDWCLFNEDGFCERSRGSILGGMCDLYDDPEYTHLKEENEKLRELAKAAWGCVKRQVSCDDCRIVACGCTLQTAMRELGLEVGDA